MNDGRRDLERYVMRLYRVVAPTIAVLIVGSAAIGHAGDAGSTRGHSSGEPSDSMSTSPPTPGGDRRLDWNSFAGMAVIPWYPFGGTAVIPWDADDSMRHAGVLKGSAETAEPVIATSPEPVIAQPKFVWSPTPTAARLTGPHTVIIQRGPNIGVESLP